MSAPDPLEMATDYQRSAVVAAAVETGIAAALADGPRGAEEVAAACGTHPRATLALLRAMAALGLATEDERFALTEPGAALVGGGVEGVAEIVRKEWFFYRAWTGLPDTVRDGHARIPPWRERLDTDPDTALAFLRALDDLAARFGGELPELAALRGPGRLLDVGGGAGSHAAALTAAVPGLEATVLDLPAVEPVVRQRHPEIAFLSGDLDEPRFGRPTGEQWDAVLLANILHDHPPERCAAYVREAAALLAPGGTLLAYEWLAEDGPAERSDLALFALMMMVENEGGYTWTADQVASWAEAAGLVGTEVRRGGGPIAVVRARLPGATQADASAEKIVGAKEV